MEKVDWLDGLISHHSSLGMNVHNMLLSKNMSTGNLHARERADATLIQTEGREKHINY